MAFSKKSKFSDEIIQLADFSRILSHPARIVILKTIAEKGGCICSSLVDILPLAQSTVSQHLKELAKAGLIRGTIEGPKICYCVNWEKLGHYSSILTDLIKDLKDYHCCK